MMLLLESLPAGRLFGLDSQTVVQVIAQLINVSLLAYVLSRLLYKPVRNFLTKRNEKISDQLKQSEDSMTEANAYRQQYEYKLRNIEKERDTILDEARKQAAEKSKQIFNEARDEAEAIRTRASVEAELEMERIKDEMRHTIIEVASRMAEKFVTLSIDSETQNRLYNETMAELEEAQFIHSVFNEAADTTA